MLAELVVDSDIAVQLNTDVREPFNLAPKRLEQVLRITREALLNALRHAQAEHIVVRVRQDAENTIVSVVDDGRGFDPVHGQEGDGDHHFGLRIMRARAARIGGTLRITSEPGQGTCVTLSFVTAVSVSRRFDVARDTTSLWMHPEEDSVYERI
jgi:signal transduction histidine kinase